MLIYERVKLYKSIFKDCKALPFVKQLFADYNRASELEALEGIRWLNTRLSEAYMVTLPVVTFYVRDNNYVRATQEIYLSSPDIEGFLHQYRHHLQNEARKYRRRELLVEDKSELDYNIPYTDTVYYMEGEDDALAWSKFILDLCGKVVYNVIK